MISGTTSSSCFPNVSHRGFDQMYPPPPPHHQHHHHHHHHVAAEDVVSSSPLDQASSGSAEAHSSSLLYSLSLLNDKVHQVQSLVSILISPDQSQPESTSIALASMGSIVKEIIVTASSILFACQQMMATTGANSSNPTANDPLHQSRGKAQESGLSQQRNFVADHGLIGQEKGQTFFSGETFDWYGEINYTNCCNNTNDVNRGVHVSSNNRVQRRGLSQDGENSGAGLQGKSQKNYDIIELDAADLLAKYTHYCQVCGKGFKRDANLRMHMRAHGDEYKTSAALSNPMKNNNASAAAGVGDLSLKLPRKYSCPHQGCRWNQKHAKFQPLKSMICVKNHYKRSHCPKMYMCKRCNQKQFSVLSDLRTHEKHCGDLKWQCSCGTTFSRKDKLLGHVALFVGHTPLTVSSTTKPAGDVQNQEMQMQVDHDRHILSYEVSD